ncbi:family 43 glycosylhydrolase [Paenibacillus sp. FA6]|uniref:family 43 glycosylhydrolase n=1 Tax=Paenibacillus sp. FA6 TaxID=3413029 RepID=UPI003F65D43E
MSNSKIPEQALKTKGSNPIVTTIFTADPSAHVWDDGKIYIYASHDMDPARGCDLMDRYHVFSSEDMVNWLDEGEILSSDGVAWGRPEGGFMWAPDCAYKNGTYYFYYPHPSGTSWNDTWKIGVATSDQPASGFVDQGYVEGLGGFALIDPCVLVDDDQRAYMYYGGGGICLGLELDEDMMSARGEIIQFEGIEDFHEAAWVFKRNGLYYLTYADNLHANNQMRYAISESPLGPWTYKGIFLEPTGCDTTHGSVAQFKGKWYLFYHNQVVSGIGNLRSMCIDELEFNDDGTIRMVLQTKEGLAPADVLTLAHPNPNDYSVANCVVGGGATIQQVADNVEAITGLELPGSYCHFDHIDGSTGGRAAIYIHHATEQYVTKLRLQVNDIDYTLINAMSTGSLTNFTGCAQITVQLEAGSNNTIKLAGGNGAINIIGITVIPFNY